MSTEYNIRTECGIIMILTVIIIIIAPGTTLLRFLLRNHPDISALDYGDELAENEGYFCILK